MNPNNPIIVVGDGVKPDGVKPTEERSGTDILLVAAERIHHRMESEESEDNGGSGAVCDDELGFGNAYCCCAIDAQLLGRYNPQGDYLKSRLFELYSEHAFDSFIWAMDGDFEARILGLLLLREIMLDEEAEREAKES